MTARIYTLPASPFAQSTILPPRFVSEVMNGREDRRRVRRTAREFHLSEVDLGRARNSEDCCAVCAEPLDARQFIAWAPDTMIVSHIACSVGGT